MKFCQPHWNELRKAIDNKGLGHLVASSGEAAMERVIAEVKGEDTTATYDPLMSAHWMICGQALENGGLYLLNGDYCPLCELEKHSNREMVINWIEGCTNQVFEDCLAKGLKPIQREQ